MGLYGNMKGGGRRPAAQEPPIDKGWAWMVLVGKAQIYQSNLIMACINQIENE